MPSYKKRQYTNRYAPYIRAAGGLYRGFRQFTQLRNRMRGGQSRTITTRRGVLSGQGVTNQYDKKLVYRKRRMPRYKKRRWIKYCKKVNAVAEKDLGTKTVVFSDAVQTSNSTDANNGLSFAYLYGAVSGTAYINDLNSIVDAENALSGANATGKLLFQSGVLDVTIQNSSYYNTNVEGGTLELDIYELTGSKRFLDGSSGRDILGVFSQAASITPAVGGAPLTTSLALTNRGVTPFDLPQAMTEYGIKIWKKTKFILSFGQACTYQVRDPRRHVVDKAAIDRQLGSNWPGMTRILLIVFKLLPYDISRTAPVAQITMGVTRKYMYKVAEKDGDVDAYVNTSPF